MSKIIELEQSFIAAWSVTDDLKIIAEMNQDNVLADLIMGLSHVYNLRFEKAWSDFEGTVDEYYAYKNKEQK